MKKIIVVAVLSCVNLSGLNAQNAPAIRNPTTDAKNSIEKKAQEKNYLCKGLRDATPTAIKSSTGAEGWYSSCNEANAVIFYLRTKRVAVVNDGAIRDKYASQNYERGPLGFPLEDQRAISGLRGGSQAFEGGCIYLIFHASEDKKSAAAFIVKGDFYKKFLASGGYKLIGLPISDEEDDRSAGGESGDKKPNGAISQSFEKGIITQKGSVLNYTAYSVKPQIRVPGDDDKKAGKAPPVKNSITVNPGELLATTYLEKNKGYYSEDKRYHLVFQEDGNLVLYKGASKAIWNSHTNGTAVKTCVMQGDGNLVMYGYNNQHVWYSDKKYDGSWFSKAMGAGDEFKAGGPVYKLIVQNDGNLVIYACDDKGHLADVRWSSGTSESN